MLERNLGGWRKGLSRGSGEMAAHWVPALLSVVVRSYMCDPVPKLIEQPPERAARFQRLVS